MEEWILTEKRLPNESGNYEMTCYDQSSKSYKTYFGIFDNKKKQWYVLVVTDISPMDLSIRTWACDMPFAWKSPTFPFIPELRSDKFVEPENYGELMGLTEKEK